MKKTTLWISILTALLLCTTAQTAPIQFSITGTADETTMGYTLGQSYTFIWILNDAYTSGSGDDYFSTTYNSWMAEQTSDPVLWSSVSGDGFLGTYSRPSGNSEDPYDNLETVNDQDGDTFSLLASNDNNENTSDLGLTVDGVDLLEISADQIDIGVDFAFSGAYSNPADYWATYAGTYTPTDGYIVILNEEGSEIKLTPTSVTIGTVPEPATALLMAFVAGLGFIIRRHFVN